MKKYFNMVTKALFATAFALTGLLISSPLVAHADPTNCYGAYAVATVCIDPTTGYGPLVYIFDANGSFIYATGVNSACTLGNYFIQPKAYDSSTFVDYSNPSSHLDAFITVAQPYNACVAGSTQAMVTVTQTQMNYIRWYSNSVNTQAVITVL